MGTGDGGDVMLHRRSMLVTGGAQGLGAAIAAAAEAAGYRVGVVDVVGAAPATAVNGHSSIRTFAASVADEQAIEDVLDEFGTPDVVVNNAGIVRFGPLVDLDVADFGPSSTSTSSAPSSLRVLLHGVGSMAGNPAAWSTSRR